MGIALDLKLFDGAAGGTGGAAPGTAGGAEGAPGAAPTVGAAEEKAPEKPGKARNPLANVQYGTQAVSTGADEARTAQEGAKKEPDIQVTNGALEAKKAEFERLIKGEYKDIFGERVQGIINERFKGAKQNEERLGALAPVVDILAGRYGVKADDAQGLLKAIEEDSGFFEAEAVERGMTVEQLKQVKRMERENRQLREEMTKRQQEERARQTFAAWSQQAEAAKQMYPNFDLTAELQNPRTGGQFAGLLKNNIPVKTAYEVIHRDEIMGGAMQYTAQQVQKKTVEDIRARGVRPAENGTGGQGAAEVKSDVHKLTKADREEIARRVARGERITF